MPPDTHAGTERGRRVLRHEADTITAQPIEFGAIAGRKINALEQDGAVLNLEGFAAIAHELIGDGGLAAARLANQPESLASLDREIDLVEHLRPLIPLAVGEVEIDDVDKRRGRSFIGQAHSAPKNAGQTLRKEIETDNERCEHQTRSYDGDG